VTLGDERRSIDVKVGDGSRALLEIVRVLDRDAVAVEGVTVRSPSLDDVFLELTGHTTVADEADEADGADAADAADAADNTDLDQESLR